MKIGRMVAILVVTSLLAACDVFTRPGPTDYRDVAWYLDFSQLAVAFRLDSIGTYELEADAGSPATCTVSLMVHQGVTWGWVEDAGSGQVVALKPQSSGFPGPPHPHLDLWVGSSCRPELTGPPSFHGTLLSDFCFEPGSGVEGLAFVGWMGAYLGGSPASAQDLYRRTEIALPDRIPQGDEMVLPFGLTLRLYPDEPEAPPVFEWSDTVDLVYQRREQVNNRSSP